MAHGPPSGYEIDKGIETLRRSLRAYLIEEVDGILRRYLEQNLPFKVDIKIRSYKDLIKTLAGSIVNMVSYELYKKRRGDKNE